MSWQQLTSMSAAEAANRAKLPVMVGDVAMHEGMRCTATIARRAGGMTVHAEVCRIDHGREHPMHIMYLSPYGDSLLDWFSPDELLEVRPHAEV